MTGFRKTLCEIITIVDSDYYNGSVKKLNRKRICLISLYYCSQKDKRIGIVSIAGISGKKEMKKKLPGDRTKRSRDGRKIENAMDHRAVHVALEWRNICSAVHDMRRRGRKRSICVVN